MKIAMPRLFRRRAPQYTRAFVRHSCQLDASLMLIDRMSSYEGRIIDISAGGAMFRPKLAYIMYRRDVPVCMTVGSEELFGQIVNTAPAGFSIRFDEPLEEEDILMLLGNGDAVGAKAAAAA